MGNDRLKNSNFEGYQIIREIDRGSQGVVYLAEKAGQQFAVKVIQSEKANIDEVTRFKKEASAMARIDHSGFVKVFEVGELNQTPYLVMELLEGETLDKHLKKMGRLDDSQVLSLAKSMAGALAEIHRLNFLHCDIKPENIFKEATKTKLIDLGMVRELGGADFETSDAVTGTMLYASPEQCGVFKSPVDQRSDLYSLGITLFEVAMGHPPFQSDDIAELMQDHANQVPPKVHENRSDFSQPLSEMIAKLLSKDPDERYQSALGLLSDLNNCQIFEKDLSEGRHFELGSHDLKKNSKSIPMIGRDKELEKLQMLWGSESQGVIRSSLIMGKGGSGKSRLALELLRKVKDSNGLVLRGKCNSVDTISFSSLRDSFENYFNKFTYLSKAEKEREIAAIKNELGEKVFSLASISLSIRDLFCIESDEIEARYTSQEKFNLDVSEVVQYFSKKYNGLCLCIDDIQWLDEATRDCLSYVSEQKTDAKILMLFTSRNDEESINGLDKFRKKITVPSEYCFELKSLGKKSSRELVQNCLDSGSVDDRVANAVSEKADYNPFTIIESLNLLVSEGALTLQGSDWVLNDELFEKIEFSNDLVGVIAARIKKLPRAAVDFIVLAAVNGQKVEPGFLQSIGQLSENQTLSIVQTCQEEGLLELFSQDTYVFSHDRIREAALSLLNEAEKIEAHKAIIGSFEALESLSREQEFMLAYHYLNVGKFCESRRGFQAFLRAGRLALESYAKAQAIEYLSRAIAIASSLEIDSELLFQAHETYALACIECGHLIEAHQSLDWCLQQNISTSKNLYLLFYKMRAYSSQGNQKSAWEIYLKIAQQLKVRYPKSKISLAVKLIFQLILTIKNLVFFAPKKIDLTSKKSSYSNSQLLAQVNDVSLQIAFHDGRIIDMVYVTFYGFNQVYRELGVSPELCRFLVRLANVFSNFGLKKITYFQIDRARSIASSLNDKAVEAYVEMYTLLVHVFLGDFKTFDDSLARVREDVHKYLSVWYQSQYYFMVVSSLQQRGYGQKLIQFYKQNIDKIDSTNEKGIMSMFRSFTAPYFLSAGENKEAYDLITSCDSILLDIPNNKSANSSRHSASVTLALFGYDLFNHENESHINNFFATKGHGHFYNISFARIQCLRIEQVEKAENSQDREFFLTELQKINGIMKKTAKVNHHRGHYLVGQAALARFNGDLKTALNLLDQAMTLALEGDSQECLFWALVEKARTQRDRDQMTLAKMLAGEAIRMSQNDKWYTRVEALKSEFEISHDPVEVKPAKDDGGAILGRTNVYVDLNTKKAMNVLLEVGQAASRSIDSKQQAIQMLESLIKLMGAERAYIFNVLDDELEFYAGQDSSGHEILQPEGYSSTVISKVFDTKEPIILTGSDDGNDLSSKSIVAHNLKSIMVTPMILGGEFMGVVYVDSSLTKGLFNESDLEIFKAVSTQIATGIKNSDLASQEAVRRELQKDIELTAAVQKMFLPRTSVKSFERAHLNAFYRPAFHCGGDWWWYQEMSDGRVRGVISDVTGHGAGPAMFTASVATCFLLFQYEGVSRELPDIISKAHMTMYEAAKGEYAMTLFAFELSTDRKKLKFWSAGHPQAIVISKSGDVNMFGGRGNLLGIPSFKLNTGELNLNDGDRVFFYSDGISETMTKSGRILGEKRLLKKIVELNDLPSAEMTTQLVKQVDKLRVTEKQEDDLTFIVLDINRENSHVKQNEAKKVS